MNAKKTDLKELEGWYEKSGNQLMLLYGGMDCRKEQLIKEFCVGKKYFYYRCRQLSAGTDAENGRRNSKCFSDEAEQVFL